MDYAVSLHIMSFNNIFSNAKIHIFYVFSKSVMQNLANNGKNNGKMRLFNRQFAHPPSQRHNNSGYQAAIVVNNNIWILLNSNSSIVSIYNTTVRNLIARAETILKRIAWTKRDVIIYVRREIIKT